jgi:hypothetical protein
MNEKRYVLRLLGWGPAVLVFACLVCVADAPVERRRAGEARDRRRVLVSKGAKETERTEPARKEGEVIAKRVTGRLSAISKRCLSVVYRQDEKKGVEDEMAFILDDGVREANRQTLERVRVGDRVSVAYDEVLCKDTEQAKEGDKKEGEAAVEKTERKVRSITLVRRADASKRGEGIEKTEEKIPRSIARLLKKLGATDAEAMHVYKLYKQRSNMETLKKNLMLEVAKKERLEREGKVYHPPGREGGK